MHASDKLVSKALDRFAKRYAVIYLPDLPTSLPLTAAGEFRERAFFMLGPKGHWVPESLEARVTPVGVGFYEAEELRYYVTSVEECPELNLEDVIKEINIARGMLGKAGIAQAIVAVDPLHEREAK